MLLPDRTADYLRTWASKLPDKQALRWDGGTLTYRELHERSSRVANALARMGVGAGDRVAYLDKNSAEHLEILFGAAKVNAVPCPLNFRLAAPEVAYIVNDSAAKVLIIGAEFQQLLEAAGESLQTLPVLTPGDEYEAWLDAEEPDDPYVPQAAEDIAYQLYSSGTTGRPKGVQISQANLVADLATYPELLRFGQDSTSLAAMPLYHIGGGSWALLGIRHGATDVLVRDIEPAGIAATLADERVTHAFLVPAVLQAVLGVPEIERYDFSELQTMLYGASPISERVLSDAIRTFGCDFVQGYGLTETTGTIIYLPGSDHDPGGPNPQRLRAIGVPIEGSAAKIADPQTGVELPAGSVGEIWVKGPTVMVGYWKMPAETGDTITPDGWLRTGDAGYVDQDGYFYLHDRVKDMIVSGGENIYPAEVENVLMFHDAVADAAVIGIPSEKWGETPLAFVVGKPGVDVESDDLLSHCRHHLAAFKCPTRVEWIEELPRNPSGKVLKKNLRAPFWEGQERHVH